MGESFSFYALEKSLVCAEISLSSPENKKDLPADTTLLMELLQGSQE